MNLSPPKPNEMRRVRIGALMLACLVTLFTWSVLAFEDLEQLRHAAEDQEVGEVDKVSTIPLPFAFVCTDRDEAFEMAKNLAAYESEDAGSTFEHIAHSGCKFITETGVSDDQIIHKVSGSDGNRRMWVIEPMAVDEITPCDEMVELCIPADAEFVVPVRDELAIRLACRTNVLTFYGFGEMLLCRSHT